MMNSIWQSLCLDLVNSNVYAKLYQNIPKGLSLFFPEFEPQQILDRCQMTFDNLFGVMMNDIMQSICLDLVNSNVYAKFYQNIPKGSREIYVLQST